MRFEKIAQKTEPSKLQRRRSEMEAAHAKLLADLQTVIAEFATDARIEFERLDYEMKLSAYQEASQEAADERHKTEMDAMKRRYFILTLFLLALTALQTVAALKGMK